MRKPTNGAQQLIEHARKELRNRFLGSLVAGLFIATTMLALWLKTRELESRSP